MSKLSKREEIASRVIAALCCNPSWDENDFESKASASVDCADVLLAELERTAPKPISDDDGWIAHKPGDEDDPPISAMECCCVEVKFRNTETHFIRNPKSLHWSETGGPYTITAWRSAR